MSRLFKKNSSLKIRNTNKRSYKRFIYLAFEGNKTEPTYFHKILNNLNKSKTYLTKAIALDRKTFDTLSHPKHIKAGLIDYYNKHRNQIIDSEDKFAMIIDIDRHFDGVIGERESNYHSFLKSLKKSENKKIDISCYVTHPCFELWMLLHIKKASYFDLNKLNTNTNHRASKRAKSLYHRLKTEELYENPIKTIDNAIKNSRDKVLENDLSYLYKNVGTNLADLFDIILESN